MSFGSFLKGVAAQVNPFDKGRTYSSVQDEEERKRRAQQALQGTKSGAVLQGTQWDQIKRNKPYQSALDQQRKAVPKVAAPRVNITNMVAAQPKPGFTPDPQKVAYWREKQFEDAVNRQNIDMSGLEKILKFGPSAATEATRDVTTGIARGIARVPITAITSGAQLLGKPLEAAGVVPENYYQTKLGSVKVNNPVAKKVLGGEPIESYQTRQAGYEKSLGDSRFRNVAGPLSVLGIAGVVGSDVIPLPTKGASVSLKALAGAKTKAEVTKLVGTSLSDDAIQAIAGTEDDNLIKAIVQSEVKPTIPKGQEKPTKNKAGLIPLNQEGKINLPWSPKQNLHYSSSNGITKVSGKADQVRQQLKLQQLNQGGYAKIPGKGPDSDGIQDGYYNIKNGQLVPKETPVGSPEQIVDEPIEKVIGGLPPAQKAELDKVAQHLGAKDTDELLKTVKPQGSSDISEVVPENLSSRLAEQAQQVKETYKPRGLTDKSKAAWDPRYRAIEIDRKYAKQTGKKVNDVNAVQKLDSALEESQQAKHIAFEYLKDSNIAKVIGKYGAKGKAADDINTYRIFKRDLEQRAAGRPAITRDVSDTDMQSWVKNYEAKNPQAEEDLKLLVKDIEAIQDLAVKSDGRFLSPEDLKAARVKPDGSRFEYFTPVQRATAEELERPSIGASNVGTLGKQKVLQEFTGSDIPIDPTFDAVTDYVETVFRQLGQSRAVKLYSERTKQGLTDAKVIRTGDESARLKQMQGTFKELGDIQKSLGSQKLRISYRASAARKQASDAQKAASNRARQLLRDTVDDPDAKAVISELSDKDLTDILKVANEPDVRAVPNVNRIYKSLIGKSEAHRKLVENLQDIKMDMASIKAARQGLSRDMVDLRLDTRGQQVIAGLDKNGNMFKIEVPPSDAIMLQGLDNEKINGALKAIHAAQTPFRQAFTGVLNPGFQVAQATFNAVMAPFVSRRGIKIYSPDSIAAAVKSLSGRDEFTQAIRGRGAIRYGGGFEQLTKDSVAEALAAKGSTGATVKWYANPKRGWRAFESLGGKLDQMARTAAARAEYRAAKQANLPENAAIVNARYAYNNVLPNFRNLSSLVRGVDHALMYTGASQAGTRTLLRSFKNDPVRQAARLGVLGAGIAGIAGYNMSQDKGKEFYDDMRKSGRGYLLDNNAVVVTPGASKDKETGKWDGVFMIPVPPEMRPFNRSIQKAIYDGKPGVPVKDFGLALFDFVTGQSRTLSNPAVQTAASLATGKDVHTGQQITDETMTPEEKNKARGEFTLNSLGVAGQSVSEGGPGKFLSSVKNRFVNPKGQSTGAEFYNNQSRIIKEVGLNKNELNDYYSDVAPPSKDLAGNDIKEKTYYDTSSKATTWLQKPKTFEVSKRLDAENRKRGEPGDPLFDLDPEQRKLALNLMANYSPGNYEEKAIYKLNPWLEDFNKKRSDFFDTINEKNKSRLEELQKRPDAKSNESIANKIKTLKTNAANYGIDPMGVRIPKADDALKAKLDEYKTITDGKTKHQYTVDNPEIADYFTDQNNYKRTKRMFLGLPQFDNYPTPSPDVQKLMDAYQKIPKGNGKVKRDGTRGSPDRSAWIKSHPKEWEAMGAAFDKIAAWNAADEGALAVYEGLNAEGNPDGTPLKGGSGSGGGGGFNFGFTPKSPTNPTIDLTNFVAQLKGSPISEPAKLKYKQVASRAPRGASPKRINIASLSLPNAKPTFKVNSKGR